MKKLILLSVIAVLLLCFPKLNFGQFPDFGAASGFAVFSSAGAFSNVGPSIVTGDVGNNAGAFTAFPPGTLYGQIHNIDAVSGQAATSLASVNADMLAITCGTTIAPTMGNGQVLTPGVYCQTIASTLTGDLTLDAQGDPNAIFILKFGDTYTTAALSNIILANSASLCNVYWHIVGAVVLGANSSFGGTIVSNAAITLSDGAALSGRALTTAGAISLTNNIITIAAPPAASVISADSPTTFCSGGSVVLSGNNNGVWNTAESTTSITVNAGGDYFVTNSNSFCSIESNHINVTVNALPMATVGNDVSICNGNNVTLGTAAIADHTYSWTPATGLSSSTLANPVASPTVTTTYTLTETITATGCTETNSVIVTVDNVLTASVISANGPTTFCADANVVLSGNNGGTWSNTASISTPSLTVNTSGDYFVTNTNACNTVVSNHIIITVNPQAAAETGGNVSICNGDFVTLGAATISGHSYSWTPTTGLSSSTIANPVANPSVTTVYSLTETIDATGCNKTNSVTVVVNPIPLATTGSDAAICDSITLGATPIAGHSYSWTPTIGLSSAIIANPIASPPATTIYTLTETITATGCMNTNAVQITVNPLPLAFTGNNTTICDGFNLTLGTTALSGHTYLWTPATGLNSATIANPVANPSVTTTYTLTETITLTGCQKTNTVIITVNPLPLANTGNNASICSGNSTALGTAPIAGHTYLWTPTEGLSSALIANPLASPSATTTYTLTESITATGCENTNSVIITVNPLPAAFTGPNTTICKGDEVTLGGTAITGNTYLWSPSTSLSIATVSNPVASPASTETYQLIETVTLTGCSQINYVEIIVNPLPLAATGSNTAICIGNSVTLGAPAISGHSYSWTPSNGLSSVTSAQPYASPLTTTTYTLTETNTATACFKTNSVIVTVNPLPPATTVTVAAICLGDSVAIGGNSTTGNTYLWAPITDLNEATISNPMASPTVTTIYSLTETIIATGCSKSNSVTVLVDAAPNIITQPADIAVLIGNQAVFSVEVTGTNLTYQWRKGLTDLTNSSNISGADTDTLTIIDVSLADTSSSYNVVISGMCFINTTSQNASLSIAIPTVIVNNNCADAIALLPNTTCNYTTTEFSGATMSGAAPSCATSASQDIWYKFVATDVSTKITIQWVNGINHGFELIHGNCSGSIIACVNDWSGLSTNNEIYFNNNFIVGQTYYIRVFNALNTLSTLSFGICIEEGAPVVCTPTIAISSNQGTSICQGQQVIYSAAITNGGTNPIYQWKSNGTNVGTGLATYTSNTNSNSDVISCELISNEPCANPAIVTSNELIMIVNPIPQAPIAGCNSPVNEGGTLSLTATAISGVNYEWTGPLNYAANTQNPTVSNNATSSMAGYYKVKATANGCSSLLDSTLVVINPVSTDSACGLQEFSQGLTPPAGWVFNNLGALYTSTTYSGLNPPAIKFDITGASITTANVYSPSLLSFWIRGASTDNASSLVVKGLDGTNWVVIDSIVPLPTSGTIKTYPIITNFSKFQFTYYKSVGNLAFDDVNVVCGTDVGFDRNTSKGKLFVYPNPNSGIFYIKTDMVLSNAVIEVCDNIGKLQHSQVVSYNNDLITVDISGLADGMYFISIKNGNAVIKVSKIIKH